jgi:hypothetical protein
MSDIPGIEAMAAIRGFRNPAWGWGGVGWPTPGRRKAPTWGSGTQPRLGLKSSAVVKLPAVQTRDFPASSDLTRHACRPTCHRLMRVRARKKGIFPGK